MIEEIQWGSVFFTLIVFIVLFLLLKKYAFGPVMSMMQEREERVASYIETAEQNREEAQKYLAEQKQELDQARTDAQTILENARQTSEKQAEDIRETAKQEVEQYKNVARNEINREKEQAIEALRKEVGVLSVQLAGKLIEKELDDKKQQELVDDYLKEVGNPKWLQ